MLSVIEESGTNLLNLVREVLDRESKKIEPEELEYSTVSITELFERVVSMNRAKSVVKNVKLDYSVSPAGIKLDADQNKLEIAVNNLVSNALKFTPSGGEVVVHAIQNNGSLEIRVQDTGIGIPEKLQEDLFTNPDKPSRNGTNGEVGTGLGLDIVQLYVELHEGKIWVESELDKGTTFFISLPLEEKLA
ncbi:sensor histidine kinase [Gracilimonas sediminicola]|uniref:sensor histidine kinase n=3 Tax=Gracilimonas TaxID=649462 RepID=UPI0038D3B72F